MIRKSVVSGRFYPEDSRELTALINKCYANKFGANNTEIERKGKLLGFIAPHAGFIFSGAAASCVYSRLQIEPELPKTVILLGPKHTLSGADFAVSAANYWQTPMGKVKVNVELASMLVKSDCGVIFDDLAHIREHSLEVQLPFLQHLYKDKSFDILPVAIGYSHYNNAVKIAKGLNKILKQYQGSFTVVLSSDFSHDSTREQAYSLDKEALQLITELKSKEFYNLVVEENRSICGLMPICTGIELFKIYAEKTIIANILQYYTSMDMMPHERGVGYAAVSFEVKEQ